MKFPRRRHVTDLPLIGAIASLFVEKPANPIEEVLKKQKQATENIHTYIMHDYVQLHSNISACNNYDEMFVLRQIHQEIIIYVRDNQDRFSKDRLHKYSLLDESIEKSLIEMVARVMANLPSKEEVKDDNEEFVSFDSKIDEDIFDPDVFKSYIDGFKESLRNNKKGTLDSNLRPSQLPNLQPPTAEVKKQSVPFDYTKFMAEQKENQQKLDEVINTLRLARVDQSLQQQEVQLEQVEVQEDIVDDDAGCDADVDWEELYADFKAYVYPDLYQDTPIKPTSLDEATDVAQSTKLSLCFGF